MIATTPARHCPTPLAPTPLASGATTVARADLREIDGRPVSWFAVEGGERRGAIGPAEGLVVERAIRVAIETGIPVVGRLATSGADVSHGVASLHAWGRVARALAEASGTVPVVLAVSGPCVSGPALLLGLADHVVMTAGAFAYVSGPGAVAATTGVATDHGLLGGSDVHATRSGVASLVVGDDEDDEEGGDNDESAIDGAVADLLSFLPSNSLDDPPRTGTGDPPDRPCERAAVTVPGRASASYDVRAVVTDVLDAGTFLEVRARFAPNIVTGYGRLDGRAVGVVANQPCQRAGTVDIAAAQKAARFVQSCDALNVPLLTFVDTPGFEPGKEQEWRGMIRHGAQLVHAYAGATVPRLCVVLRKAYGGAYIVMDSRGMGSDWCAAWPGAEIAVMGAQGAVGVLHGRRLAALDDPGERAGAQARLEAEYSEAFLNPHRAAERGFVDAVIEPSSTRPALAAALARLATKREPPVRRRHSNSPL